MSPYRDAAHLQAILERVFQRGYAGDEAGLIVRQRLAVAFVFRDPDLHAHVDGRDGAAVRVTFGPDAASLPADLTFRLDGEATHPFWLGELNPMTAMGQGRLRIEGSLIRAIALSPSLPHLQRAYREEYAAQSGQQSG